MGNFEKLGILVIIMLVVVIMVLMVWGVAQPVGDLGSDLAPPRRIAAEGPSGSGTGGSGTRGSTQADPQRGDVPQVKGSGPGTSPWPDDNPRPRPDVNPTPNPDPDPDPDPDPVQGRNITHVVKDGESFYGMAVQYYRDGTKFLVIQEANPDIDPQSLSVGMKIIIPDPDSVLSDAPRPAPQPVARAGNTYVVKDGDSLWRIAKETLGKGTEFPKILDANRDLLGDNGDDLQPGMTLVIPR